MKQLTRIEANKVFTESEALFGHTENHTEQAVDQFLKVIKKEMLAGRLGQIETSVDFLGTKNVRVSLEAYKLSFEDIVVKKLNSKNWSIDELLDLGAKDVKITKLPENNNDKKMITITLEESNKKMYFYFNGEKWRQKITY